MAENIRKFIMRELKLRVWIHNLECNLTYPAIEALIHKYFEKNRDHSDLVPKPEDKRTGEEHSR